MAHAVAMLRDHSLFLAEDVQPILSEAGLPMYSAKVGRNTLLCSSASAVLSHNGSWRESCCWLLGRVCPTNGRHCDGAAARGLARANGPARSDDPHRPRGMLLAWPACPLRIVRYSQASGRFASVDSYWRRRCCSIATLCASTTCRPVRRASPTLLLATTTGLRIGWRPTAIVRVREISTTARDPR